MRSSLIKQVKIAVLSGMAFMIMLLPHVPIFPPAPFLTYDASEVPALLGGFALGPWAGMAIVIVKNLLILLYRFGPAHLVGIPMNTLAGCALVGVSASFYWRGKSMRTAAIGLLLGTLAMAAVMIPANYLIFDTIMGIMNLTPSFSVSFYVLALCTPFNLIKGLLSSLLAFLIYKRVSAVLK